MNIQRNTPVMGAWWVAVAEAAKDFFSAKGGQVTVVPSAPAPLSMPVVGALAGAVVLVVLLKREKIL